MHDELGLRAIQIPFGEDLNMAETVIDGLVDHLHEATMFDSEQPEGEHHAEGHGATGEDGSPQISG